MDQLIYGVKCSCHRDFCFDGESDLLSDYDTYWLVQENHIGGFRHGQIVFACELCGPRILEQEDHDENRPNIGHEFHTSNGQPVKDNT